MEVSPWNCCPPTLNFQPDVATRELLPHISTGCVLCRVLNGGRETPFTSLLPDCEPSAQVVASNDHAAVVVDVAPLGIGHCLVLPRRHALAVSLLSSGEFSALRAYATLVASAIQATARTPIVCFEHGQVFPTAHLSEDITTASCGIDHAHLHVLAYPHIPPTTIAGQTFHELDSPEDILLSAIARQPYLYIEHFGRGQSLCPAVDQPPQILRYVFRDAMANPPPSWHWHDHILFASAYGTRERVRANLRLLQGLSLTPE